MAANRARKQSQNLCSAQSNVSNTSHALAHAVFVRLRVAQGSRKRESGHEESDLVPLIKSNTRPR
eukprot:scaffold24040_cov67-Phaeocystis_antarctica.AAC.5